MTTPPETGTVVVAVVVLIATAAVLSLPAVSSPLLQLPFSVSLAPGLAVAAVAVAGAWLFLQILRNKFLHNVSINILLTVSPWILFTLAKARDIHTTVRP